MSQTRIYHFYTINLDHSYDQVVQANAANKMLAILGSMGAVEVTSDEIDAFKNLTRDEALDLTDDMIKARLVQEK